MAVTRERAIVGGALLAAAVTLGMSGLFLLRPGLVTVRVSPLAFLVFLIVELALLFGATSTNPSISRGARVGVFLVPLIVNLGLRAYQALGTRDLLEWDETYYYSLAVTSANGRGLYPYIFGFGPMTIMGGIGYSAYAYALAILVAGPTILALRVVSLAASVAGLAFMWLLVRRLYGSGAAWMATALTSALRLFLLSNSVRMDSMTFAFVAAALLVATMAFERWTISRWHILSGFVFGLGLQVHIDTVITAFACGAIYVAIWIRDMALSRQARLQKQMWLYLGGFLVALGLFVVCNVLPDPTAFYKITALVRVDATSWYSAGTASTAASFLNPRIVLAKEVTRYSILLRMLPRLEVVLAIVAMAALAFRRTNIDQLLLVGIGALLVASAIVLNNASPLYFIHVTPLLIVPMAPLLTHGFTRTGSVSTRDTRVVSLLGFAVVVSALCAVNTVKSVRPLPSSSSEQVADAQLAERVRAVVDRQCVIAGDGALYVRYFPDYPQFISTRPTEVRYGMLYYGTADEEQYWSIKRPDAVFSRGALSDGLARYVAQHGFSRVGDGIWRSPRQCAKQP